MRIAGAATWMSPARPVDYRISIIQTSERRSRVGMNAQRPSANTRRFVASTSGGSAMVT